MGLLGKSWKDAGGQLASPLPGPASESGSTGFTGALEGSAEQPGKSNLLKPELLASLNGKTDSGVLVMSAKRHIEQRLKAHRFGAQREGL